MLCRLAWRGGVPDDFQALFNAPQALAGSLPLLEIGVEVHDLGRILHLELADNPETGGMRFALKLSHAYGPPLTILLAVWKELADCPGDHSVRMEGKGLVLDTPGPSDERQEVLLPAENRDERDIALTAVSKREGMEGRTEGRADVILAIREEPFGPIPGATVKRDRSADPEAPWMWVKALTQVRELDDVLRRDVAR